MNAKCSEVQELRKNIKITTLNEYIRQINVLEDECARLRQLLLVGGKRKKSPRYINPRDTNSKIKKVVKEEEIKEVKQLIKIKLIEQKISLDRLMNTIFNQYNEDENISIKELSKLFQKFYPILSIESCEKLARYFIEDKNTVEINYNSYSFRTVSYVKKEIQKFFTYSFNEPEVDSAKVNAYVKFSSNLAKLAAAFTSLGVNLDSISFDVWENVLTENLPGATNLEKDILISAAYRKNQDLRTLSFHVLFYIS